MQSLITKLLEQFKAFYKSLSPMKRTSIIAAALIVSFGFVIVGMMLTGRAYTPLFTNVPIDQMPLIVSKLQEKQVPYTISDGGKTITVPPELLHSTQMMLMSETGFTKLGQIGFELFDKDSFGTTSYVQRVNYQRALQGELMRTINSLNEVRNSKVILALPPKKTFLEEGDSPSASVVVDLKDNQFLKPDQVRGIIHLVASAVEGLDPSRVAVVDSRGKVLSKNMAGGPAAMSNEMMEYKFNQEQMLETRIEEILSKVVGQGKIIARVNADVNFRQISSVEEVIDPDHQAVHAIQSEEEKLRGNRTNAAGVPGARANLPGAEDPNSVGFKQDVDKEIKTTNFDNSKTVRNIKEPVGTIEKLSVAVLVDGVTTFTTDKNGKTAETWTPRSQEELQKYETIVRNTIGFNDKRGDTVKIENIKFQREDFSDSEKLMTAMERKLYFQFAIKWGLIVLIFGLFFFVVVRPFMKWVTLSFQESVEDVLPKTIEELEDLQTVDNTLPGMSGALPMLEETIDPDKAEAELLKERILTLLNNDGKKAAFALSQWAEDR